MPTMPSAPGTLITGSETPSPVSMIFDEVRASRSAPPPAPQGTMKLIGWSGNAACASGSSAPSARVQRVLAILDIDVSCW